MLLAEKALSVTIEPMDLFSGVQQSAAFLEKNPFGAVPVLELDDGSVIPESLAIIEYIEECYPEPSLWGDTPYERSMARAWERRAELGILLQATRRFLHTNPFFAPRLQQSSHAVNEAARTLTDRLSLFDRHLGESEWVAAAFSVADITLHVGIEFATMSDFHLQAKWRNLDRWTNAIKSRASTKA